MSSPPGLIEQIGLVAHDKVVGNGVFPEVDAAPVHDLLHLKGHEHGKALGGQGAEGLGSVVRVSAGGKDRLNAMYMVDGYGENNPIVVKSQFIMSLVERIDPNGVGKLILKHDVELVDKDVGALAFLPVQGDAVEHGVGNDKVADGLQLFTQAVDVEHHHPLVQVNGAFMAENVKGAGGEQLQGQGFNSAWRQFRKRNAYPTAITQNVEYLLDSVQASTMLSNSEFIVMLNQAASDREKLARLLNPLPYPPAVPSAFPGGRQGWVQCRSARQAHPCLY